MSTELGEVDDCLNPDYFLEVALGTGGVRIVLARRSKGRRWGRVSYAKVWLDEPGVDALRNLLDVATPDDRR